MNRATLLLASFASVAMAFAQSQEPPPDNSAATEQAELTRAVAEAGASGIDFTKALEKHLEKYPQSAQRLQIEKALAKTAMDANDRARIVLYGERVLNAEPGNDDLQLIDRVTRCLLDTDDPAPARKAVVWAKRYLADVQARRSRPPEGHLSAGLWAEEINKGEARALVLQARATGNAGNVEEAEKIAAKAWAAQPNAESAREVARWLVRLGRKADAIEYYADAFTIDDGRSTESDRTRDRTLLSELYTALNGSEKGLGDTVLQAYDRMAAMKKDRLAKIRMQDPNAGATELVDFSIPNADGTGSLSLASLKGKAVVMDFWATWCGPCRVQHPMIENVKKRFEKSGNVVFLSIDSDDDHELVAPFLKEMNWNHPVYFDAGLGAMLKISSIPTIVVLDTAGSISSRMAGFIPERFEDMLTQRIEEARENRAPQSIKN